ncbi:DUF6185 family protein [Streptomyces abikoensis]|uniref:DUF6185 family protein n=1 Tax=Streptomyces abikoensis TaxID=97398 RepID=UPI003692A664
MTAVARRAGRCTALLLACLVWSGAPPARAEAGAEARVDARVDARTEVRAEARAEARTEVRSEVRAEARPEARAAPHSEVHTEAPTTPHGEAPAAPGPATAECHADQLATARTEATLRIDNRSQSVAAAIATMTIRAPISWTHANDLLLSENSAAHQQAMRCLLRDPRDVMRPDEFRPHSPQVVTEASWVKVRYDTLFQFNKGGQSRIGPWAIGVRPELWTLSLVPPPALAGAHWDDVRIELGGLATSQVTPRPAQADSANLLWRDLGPPGPQGSTVTVQLVPPWQRAWVATSSSSEPWLVANAAGMTTWWLGAAGIIVFAALQARRWPAGSETTALQDGSSAALLRWGLLKAVLGVLVLLLYKMVLDSARALKIAPTWLGYEFRWPALVGFLAAWTLVVTARPRNTVLAAATVLTLVGGLVAAAPSLFGLPPQLVALKGPAAATDLPALLVMAAAMLWLWLAGLVLWARLLAHDGGLLRPHASPWRLRRTGTWLTVTTLLFLGWAVWASERHWKRVSWLSDQGAPDYRVRYRNFLSKDLVSFTAELPAWFYSHTWALTGIAIVALLRARDLAPRMPYASPTKLDRLLLAVFFAVVVAWRQGSYAGSQLLASLWLVLDLAALYGLLAVGQRRAVLTQHFEGCSRAPALGESISETGLNDLIARARRYRELIGLLRGMDPAQHPDAPGGRHAVEKEMSRLHHWRPQGGTRGSPRLWLPGEVTVVDVALSWGPYARWWDNARRAALLAAVFGLPGSVVLVWASYAPEQVWMRQKQYFFGAPEMVWAFVSWELTWAGAGLVLGALWRLLPGRRGPARALGLVIAYALLIGLGSLGNLITNQGVGNVAFGVCLMLLVLTLTGLAMDLDTFRSERRLWPSRIQLLLSIYQMRSFSAQIAYVLVQLVAVLTILRFFVGPESRSLK